MQYIIVLWGFPCHSYSSVKRFACAQELAGLDRSAFVAFSIPDNSGGLKDNVGAIVGVCIAALGLLGFLAFLSSRRRRGHSFKRDAWGLPSNPVVRTPVVPANPPRIDREIPNIRDYFLGLV